MRITHPILRTSMVVLGGHERVRRRRPYGSRQRFRRVHCVWRRVVEVLVGRWRKMRQIGGCDLGVRSSMIEWRRRPGRGHRRARGLPLVICCPFKPSWNGVCVQVSCTRKRLFSPTTADKSALCQHRLSRVWRLRYWRWSRLMKSHSRVASVGRRHQSVVRRDGWRWKV